MEPSLTLVRERDGFSLFLDGREIIRNSSDDPFLFVGYGKPDIQMFRGNFSIKDNLVERVSLDVDQVTALPDGYRIHLSRADLHAKLCAELVGGRLQMTITADGDVNRLWLRLAATAEEKVFGCGEQFSYFNLRGKTFPLWTSEQGVGRNKKTLVTWLADCQENAGGDYYWTFFPQPTFVSSKKYYCHSIDSCYMDFDFADPHFHELQIWSNTVTFLFETSDSYVGLLEKLTALLGRQPELPDWVFNGVILGIQGGTEACQAKLQRMRAYGVPVAGIWAQDWEGRRITSFGKRLMWNWRWDEELYPGLPEAIARWRKDGVRFLGYINPYVAEQKSLYEEAARLGYLAKTLDGDEIYKVEFGEFYAGVVDLTNPDAFDWYKEVIKRNLITFGLDGWMADFGEYLPTDIRLHTGVDAAVMHNAWPSLWAKCNYEAVVEAGKLGEILYFMRAGYSGSQKYSVMMWAGDQNVDWSLDDGLASVVPAALSLAMSGHGLHHSDIGGYTTLFDMKRGKELLLRWCEFAAFTPMMRTHEGNRPDSNWQFDGDEETILHFARMAKIFVALGPYLRELVAENARRGVPVMRPLFLHYEEDARCYDIKYEYLLGRDLLVSPVYSENTDKWSVYLPIDEWVHLWSGNVYSGGAVDVAAPVGMPPVFYRSSSNWSGLFSKINKIK